MRSQIMIPEDQMPLGIKLEVVLVILLLALLFGLSLWFGLLSSGHRHKPEHKMKEEGRGLAVLAVLLNRFIKFLNSHRLPSGLHWTRYLDRLPRRKRNTDEH